MGVKSVMNFHSCMKIVEASRFLNYNEFTAYIAMGRLEYLLAEFETAEAYLDGLRPTQQHRMNIPADYNPVFQYSKEIRRARVNHSLELAQICRWGPLPFSGI